MTSKCVGQTARLILVWLIIYGLMVGVGTFLPVPASDWYHHFQPRYELYDYPPLIYGLLAVIPSLPFLSGLTLTALLAVLWRRRARWFHLLAAFTAMPLYWTLWLGQVDAIPMLGLAFLPWGIPLVLIKPQVAVWYAWAWWREQPGKWRIALATIMLFIPIVVIWVTRLGGWRLPATNASVYNLSLWRLWWPLGLLVLVGALLERDPDRAMALGALGVPYLQGASYLVLVPALVRLSGWPLILVWLTSWASVVTIFLGDAVRPLGALFPLSLWVALTWIGKRQPEWNNRLESDTE